VGGVGVVVVVVVVVVGGGGFWNADDVNGPIVSRPPVRVLRGLLCPILQSRWG
jgi:hypothetical protein